MKNRNILTIFILILLFSQNSFCQHVKEPHNQIPCLFNVFGNLKPDYPSTNPEVGISSFFSDSVNGSKAVGENFQSNEPEGFSFSTNPNPVYSLQNLNIPQGWSGISSYITPENANVEAIFQPIVSSLVILQTQTSFYWPGQNVNTIGDWNTHQGYKIKLTNAVEMNFAGPKTTNKTFQLSTGWSLIPVLSECNADVAALFAAKNVVVVKEVAGIALYWPAMGINTLINLEPGKSYFVLMGSSGSITFPDCQPFVGAPPPPAHGTVSQQSHLSTGDEHTLHHPDSALCAELSGLIPLQGYVYTGITHTIAIPAVVGDSFLKDDFIGAFNKEGICYGLSVWQNENASITLFGNDPTTSEKDGFDEGEVLYFCMLRPNSKGRFDLAVTFNQTLPNAEPVFSENGLSAFSEAKILLPVISDPTPIINIQIIPNPVKEAFKLVLPEVKCKEITMEIYRFDGQMVHACAVSANETIFNIQNLSRGVYILKIEIDKAVYAKRLVKY